MKLFDKLFFAQQHFSILPWQALDTQDPRRLLHIFRARFACRFAVLLLERHPRDAKHDAVHLILFADLVALAIDPHIPQSRLRLDLLQSDANLIRVDADLHSKFRDQGLSQFDFFPFLIQSQSLLVSAFAEFL
eukprot:CAMPEP_0197032204 /NCGR_PEP_ID=MMETSP1384-20130603/10942_1 /TAXON_ID=29189 /ORGANISM="Ammonia sp." /LENGTH=132 /DNA_ID=CAMNT_0042461831 /DNA_START=119 /DNA_END=513 /DNA_ORIENTATION=+